MSLAPDLGPARGRRRLAGVPPGADARLLADLARRPGVGTVLHVAAGLSDLRRLMQDVPFWAPGLEVVGFPAWDVLPYDRASPSGGVVAERVETLTILGRHPEPDWPRLVLTTPAALLSRLPPRRILLRASYRIQTGAPLDADGLHAFLRRNGYCPVGVVREPGDYAFHPERIDVFPPGDERPVRVERPPTGQAASIRFFDPGDQRTGDEALDDLLLRPVTELFLDDAARAMFETGYRELGEGPVANDPVFEAVASGRRAPGLEHWLPLFYDRTETLFDYVPSGMVTLSEGAEATRDRRLDDIADAYAARRSMRGLMQRSRLPPYRPLPPERAYLTAEEWDAALAARPVLELAIEGEGEDLGARPLDMTGTTVDEVVAEARRHVESGRRVLVAAPSARRRRVLERSLRRAGLDGAELVPLSGHGFVLPDIAVVPGERPGTGRGEAAEARDALLPELRGFAVGDLLVHEDHGIGLFDGLEVVGNGGAPHDCVRLVYDGGDKLLVPVESLDLVTRFGSADGGVPLDRLGGTAWIKRRDRTMEQVRDLAQSLLKAEAERRARRIDPIEPPPDYGRFVGRFPYSETEDQLRAVSDILADLRSGQCMDRLLCGDVGFGKTEVALRAAFVAAAAGWQVAVVVPTTPLCRQHHDSFRRRFAGWPYEVVQLSRSVPPAEARQVKARIRSGEARVVIGTQAVLGASVRFARLGLVIIDEEQRLGVKQKEKLRAFGSGVHVLAMSATPIPRTLQLALAGLRDLSVMATPPVQRQPVRTFAMPFDPVVVREALLRERARGGQSFYICPRLEELDLVRDRLLELVPDLRIEVAHGRLSSEELDDAMAAFAEGGADVLLATNIVESGLDIPNANTLIVHRANLFGLAQLYQIRGRVGRSAARGYAYLTWEPDQDLTPQAQRRLEVLSRLEGLGAGFELATRDLELRGAGNALGEEQSGHLRAVGLELLQRLLQRALDAARSGRPVEIWAPHVRLDLPVLIPEDYVAAPDLRIAIYRRVAELKDAAEADALAAELADRFGPPPPELETLLEVAELRRLCRVVGVAEVDIGPKAALLRFREGRESATLPDGVRRRDDGGLLLPFTEEDGRARLARTLGLLRDLVPRSGT